jgi:ankyrin repeat protein
MESSKISTKQLEQAKNAIINGNARALQQFMIDFKDSDQVKEWLEAIKAFPIDHSDSYQSACAFIACKHHFNSWSDFEKFKAQLFDENSEISQFERAVDAIVNGDIDMLKQLLHQNPNLIHTRSRRNHQSTLLIYVGANGVEDFRQKTPPKAVKVAEILIKAGSEIDAVGRMYGGTTTLGLVATSVHPAKAGFQEQLIDLLLADGASYYHAVAPDYTNGNLILACLHNGRGESSVYLASKGAPTDLEGAAGTGLLDKVKTYYNQDGSLKQGVDIAKGNLGLMWACGYGHLNVVDFMLKQGFDVSIIVDGMTALHWASHGGHLDIVEMLIQKGAPLETKNSYDGTVLGQTLWSAYNDPKPQYSIIIETLLAAGAKKEPHWDKYIDEIKEMQF